ASADRPQIQLPAAMPPKVAVWYSDSARPTTQRGEESWIDTLNSDSDSTQQAPAGNSAKWLSTASRLKPSTTQLSAKPTQAARTITSLLYRSRTRPLRKAPPTAPSPKQPSSVP